MEEWCSHGKAFYVFARVLERMIQKGGGGNCPQFKNWSHNEWWNDFQNNIDLIVFDRLRLVIPKVRYSDHKSSHTFRIPGGSLIRKLNRVS